MRILASGFAAAAALSLCAIGHAQDAGSQTEKRAPAFDEVDADRNGLISQAEAERIESLSELFGDLDENQDRYLDDREYSQYEEVAEIDVE